MNDKLSRMKRKGPRRWKSRNSNSKSKSSAKSKEIFAVYGGASKIKALKNISKQQEKDKSHQYRIQSEATNGEIGSNQVEAKSGDEYDCDDYYFDDGNESSWKHGIDLRIESRKLKDQQTESNESSKLRTVNELELKFATIQIQAWIRGLGARENVWGRFGVAQTSSAELIQRVFRGHLGYQLAKRTRFERNRKAATLIQKLWRGYQGRWKAYHTRVQRDRKCATGIQKAFRGYKGRLYAKKVRFERDTRCAIQIERVVRGYRGRQFFRKEKIAHEKRLNSMAQMKIIVENLPTALRGEFERFSDNEVINKPRIQQRMLRKAMLVFGFRGEIDVALHLLSRVLRCNPTHKVALQVKAIILIASGARDRYQMVKHPFYFVELGLDLMSKSQSENARIPTSADIEASERWPVQHVDPVDHSDLDEAFADPMEFFYICSLATRKTYLTHKMMTQFGIAIQMLGTDMKRARKYFDKAIMDLSTRSLPVELFQANKRWVDTLIIQHEQFWKHGKQEMFIQDSFLVSRQGAILVIESQNYGPLVAPYGQIVLSVKKRDQVVEKSNSSAESSSDSNDDFHEETTEDEASKENGENIERGETVIDAGSKMKPLYEFEFQDCVEFDLEYCKYLLTVTVPMKMRVRSAPKLVIPALEKNRAAQVELRKAHKNVLDIQRVCRGMWGRMEWRRRKKIKEVLDQQELVLVEKRLEKLRNRQRRRNAIKKIQAVCRGKIQRNEIKRWNEACVQMQRIARGHLGRRAFEELERKLRMGALVKEVYSGGRELVVDNGDVMSTCHVFLRVLRSGFSYYLVATDLCTVEEYHGDVAGHQVEELLEAYNVTRSKQDQIRRRMYEKVLELIVSNVRLIKPIPSVVALGHNEATMTLAVIL